MLGAVGSIQSVELHDGQHKTRALSFSPRALLGSSLSSAMLCSLFWCMQRANSSAGKREPEPERTLAPPPQAAAGKVVIPPPQLLLSQAAAPEGAAPLLASASPAPSAPTAPDAFLSAGGELAASPPTAATEPPAFAIEPPRAPRPSPAVSSPSSPSHEQLHDPWASK